jgi:5-hydroxyisourate hydrolase
MSTLTTHVLDAMHGKPAAGIPFQLVDDTGSVLFEGETNVDGRCSGLPPIASGRYALVFEVAGYFSALGVTLTQPPFLDQVRIDFGVAGEGHYHVPLLVSPYSYSTYRGS